MLTMVLLEESQSERSRVHEEARHRGRDCGLQPYSILSASISLTLRTVRSTYIMYLDRRPHPPNLNSEPDPRSKLRVEPLPAERAHVAAVWLLRQKITRFFLFFSFFFFNKC